MNRYCETFKNYLFKSIGIKLLSLILIGGVITIVFCPYPSTYKEHNKVNKKSCDYRNCR